MFKILPIMAAIFLASSCSKDDNNDVVTPTSNSKFILTVGYGSSSISKVTLASDKRTEEFDGGESISISGNEIESGESKSVTPSADKKYATVLFDAPKPVSGSDGKTEFTVSATMGNRALLAMEECFGGEDLSELVRDYGYWESENFQISKDGDDWKVTSSGTVWFTQQYAFIVDENKDGMKILYNNGSENFVNTNKYYIVRPGLKIKRVSDGKVITTESSKIYTISSVTSK